MLITYGLRRTAEGHLWGLLLMSKFKWPKDVKAKKKAMLDLVRGKETRYEVDGIKYIVTPREVGDSITPALVAETQQLMGQD